MLESIPFRARYFALESLLSERLLRAALAFLALTCFTYVLAAAYPAIAPQPIRIQSDYVSTPYFDDFAVFYAAGHLAVDGHPYDVSEVSSEEAAVTGQDASILVLPFFNPPHVLLPLALLSRLSLPMAAALWLACGFTVFLATLAPLVISRIRENGTLAISLWTLGIASSLPLIQAIVHGQMTLFLTAGYCLFWLSAFHMRRPAVAGLALTILAAKPALLVAPVIWLALSRQWRSLAWFTAYQALVTLTAFALFGAGQAREFAHLSRSALGWDEKNGISAYGMLGWHGLIRGLAGSGAREAQAGLMVLLSVVTLAALVAGLQTCRRASRYAEGFALVVLASLLISPHSYSQDLLFLAPALFLLWSERDARIWGAAALAFWFTIRVHFEVLVATGIGPVNVLLALAFGYLFLNARLPQSAAGPDVAANDNDSPRKLSWVIWPANLVLFAALVGLLVFTSGLKSTGRGVGYYPISQPVVAAPSSPTALPTAEPTEAPAAEPTLEPSSPESAPTSESDPGDSQPAP